MVTKDYHWYLAIVDMKNAEVVYVDSLPTRTTHRTRIAKIKKVVSILII